MNQRQPTNEVFQQYGREALRIRDKLQQYLPAQTAYQTASDICDLALRVNQEIGRILQDPLVTKLYDYDGLFFTPKGTGYFYRAFDGLSVLRSLSDSKIDVFMVDKSPQAGLEWMMDELGKHEWEATVRRMNWEESSNLSLVPREVLQAIADDVKERRLQRAREQSELSQEEAAFFDYYEREMAPAGPLSRPKEWLARVALVVAQARNALIRVLSFHR